MSESNPGKGEGYKEQLRELWNMIAKRDNDAPSFSDIIEKIKDVNASAKEDDTKLFVLILIDDIDKELSAEKDTISQGTEGDFLFELLEAIEKRQQPGALVVTATYPPGDQYDYVIPWFYRFFAGEQWLQAFTKTAASDFLEQKLRDKEHKDNALKLAGTHPFLLSKYVHFEREDDSNIEKRMKKDAEIQAWLDSLWRYLNLSRNPEAEVVLKRILSGRSLNMDDLDKIGLSWLQKCGVLPPTEPNQEKKAPSKDDLPKFLINYFEKEYGIGWINRFQRGISKYAWQIVWVLFGLWAIIYLVYSLDFVSQRFFAILAAILMGLIAILGIFASSKDRFSSKAAKR